MIVVYTGTGKGKTSACLGQVLRALGHGMSVAFGQFMKKDGVAGEQKLLRELLGNNFLASGEDFFLEEKQRPIQELKARQLLDWAISRATDLLILDEALSALEFHLIDRADLEALIKATAQGHLVLSGRVLPDWLFEKADIVTRMESPRHHFALGVQAVRGLEY